MDELQLLKNIREELSALRYALIDQEPAIYTPAEVLQTIGYAKSNRSFIPYAEEMGWLKPIQVMKNGSKRYPRKQVRALKTMLADGKITVEY